MSEGPLSRQPDKLDYLSPTQFRFGINQLPKVEFFTTAANIPGINLGDAVFETPFKSIPVMGDKLTYEQLTISFIVDEFLENYRSLHEWMTAIGFPKDRKQFRDFRSNTSNTPSASVGTPSKERIGKVTQANALFSDANLIILSNKNNAIIQVDFQNMYPVSLSALQFSQEGTDVQYITASATFSYQIYEFTTL
jgi:spore germination protein YaaH